MKLRSREWTWITGAGVLLASAVGGVSGCSKPKEQTITIVYSNDMVGEVRSCGCASKDTGGLGRRATFVANARKRAENFLLFDGGDFFGVDVNYGREKADLTLESMSYMGYDGVVLGEADFGYGLDYIVDRVAALRLPVVIANLYDDETNERVFPPSRRIELASGLKIGVIGVMGQVTFPDTIPAGRLRITSAQAAVQEALATMRTEVDLVVVLAHMPPALLQRFARTVKGVDFIVGGHEPRPMRKTTKVGGGAYVLETASRGRYMGIGTGTIDASRKLTSFDVSLEPLTTAYADAEAIVKLFGMYDLNIARLERARSTPRNMTGTAGGRYVGNDACRPCHEAANALWADTKHAHAFNILVQEKRELDRDCTPCHTTGFYELGGFRSVVDTPDLVNVQCEQCHGAGAEHVRDPKAKTPGDARAACAGCHVAEQTPDFKFETYWPKIAH